MNKVSTKTRIELLYFLALKELKEKYKQAYFGFVWFLLVPVVTLGAFHVIFTRFFHFEIPNYVPFLFSGLIPWFYFSMSISQGIQAIADNANLVRKVAFPRVFLPLSVVITHGLTYLMSLCILIGYLAYKNELGSFTWTTLPACILATFIIIFNLASTLSYSYVTFRDIKPIADLGLFLLFYATPVFYSLEQIPSNYLPYFQYNPICLLIEFHRMCFLGVPSLIQVSTPLMIWLIASSIIHFFTWKTLDKNISDFVA